MIGGRERACLMEVEHDVVMRPDDDIFVATTAPPSTEARRHGERGREDLSSKHATSDDIVHVYIPLYKDMALAFI